MQHMLLEVREVTEQCVVVVLDELSCRWPVSRVQIGPDSTTDNSFDAMSIICRCEAPPGTGRVEQSGENDRPVDSLQCLVVHAVAEQYVDNVQWLHTLEDDISDMFIHGELVCDNDAEYFEWCRSLNARQTLRKVESLLAMAAECYNNFFRLLEVKR